MSQLELTAPSELIAARRAEANALAYMIVALAALGLSVALVAWAIWA